MATEQCLTHSSLHNLPEEDSTEEWNSSVGFECNICLDAVRDPVVTLCGHLYCWPCIYKWIQPRHIISPDHNPYCPVCKSQISEKTLIPLYGRGQSEEKSTNFRPVIPLRPKGPPFAIATSTAMSQSPNQHDYGYTTAPAVSILGRSTAFHPMIIMFGEMICTIFSGSSQQFYTYPDNSYGVVAGSARARRNFMQIEQSLSRLSFFLCCCLVLCLVCF